MTPRDFCIWLQGFLDGVPVGASWDQLDMEVLAEKLKKVELDDKEEIETAEMV